MSWVWGSCGRAVELPLSPGVAVPTRADVRAKIPRGLTIGIKQLITVTCLREPPGNLPLAGLQFVTNLTDEAHRLSLATY